jgi:aspartate aminotransferase
MSISKKISEYMKSGSWIRRMFEEGALLKAKYGAENVFDFTLGNPLLPPPRKVLDELTKIVNENPEAGHGYMHNAGYEEVRESIAKYLKKLYGIPFTAKNIVMSSGAGGGMNILLKSILDPGDEIIIIAPYFVEYLYYIDNHGGKVVKVNAGKNFDLDVPAIEKAITPRTKGIIICSPNNPTGVVYSKETLAHLGEILRKKENEYGKTIYLINDEPYRKILYDGIEFPSHMVHYRNSVLVTSHSKDFSVPGERIGYVAIHPDSENWEDVVNAMTFCNRVLGFVNAPALWQRIAGACQDASVDVEWYRIRRDLLYNGLREIGYEVVKPQGAFYLFPKCPCEDDVAFAKKAAQFNLLVVPGSGFGTPGYFRISYCAVSLEMIERSMPIFKELFIEMKNS